MLLCKDIINKISEIYNMSVCYLNIYCIRQHVLLLLSKLKLAGECFKANVLQRKFMS